MKIKRVPIVVFTVLFVAAVLISFFAYDNSSSVNIICEKDSYSEKYAKKHNIDYKLISDSDKNIGLVNLDDFKYNEDGTIVSYEGKSETVAIPEAIGETEILRVKEDAFDNAKNVKEIYLSKTLALFEPTDMRGVTVYVPEDSFIYNLLQWKENNKLDFKEGKYTGDTVICDFDDFEVSAGGTVEAYTGDDKIISVPAKINGVKIRSIAKDAFITAKRLTKVYLPDSLEKFEPVRVANVKFFISSKSEAYKYAKGKNSKVDFSWDTDHSSLAASFDEDFDYNEHGQITEYRGVDKTIVIPDEINGTKIISVAENAFDKASGVKKIYLPDTMIAFFPENLSGIDVYADADTLVNNAYENINYDFVTYADSYYVNFYSAEIPYSYDELSGKEIKINEYNGEDKNIIIPESIDGKEVKSVNVDALSKGASSILIPGTVDEIGTDLYTPRYDAVFFIGLLICLVGFALALAAVLKVNVDTKEKTVLRLSVFTTAYAVSVLSVILAAVYMFVLPKLFNVSVWLGAVFIVILIAIGVTAFVKIDTSVEMVEEIEKKVKAQTFFIKSLTADAETLMAGAETDEAKSICKKVYEAVRYSDPMSDDALAAAETQISLKFSEFSEAVNGGDGDTEKLAKELILLIENRNKKCKMLK